MYVELPSVRKPFLSPKHIQDVHELPQFSESACRRGRDHSGLTGKVRALPACPHTCTKPPPAEYIQSREFLGSHDRVSQRRVEDQGSNGKLRRCGDKG